MEMSEIGDLKVKLGLPPVSQLGVIVRDVDKVAHYYESLFGVGPFTIYDFEPEQHIYNGEPTRAKIRMGKAMWGNMELELLQPLEGKSPHMDFFRQHGEGLHHLGFFVPNFDELCENFLREGFKPVLESASYVETYKGSIKVRYWDTDKIVGVLFEIIYKSWLPECQPR
jgi:4-hydroxyphenylpyruvate dioxygenase-like putative hemolysin